MGEQKCPKRRRRKRTVPTTFRNVYGHLSQQLKIQTVLPAIHTNHARQKKLKVQPRSVRFVFEHKSMSHALLETCWQVNWKDEPVRVIYRACWVEFDCLCVRRHTRRVVLSFQMLVAFQFELLRLFLRVFLWWVRVRRFLFGRCTYHKATSTMTIQNWKSPQTQTATTICKQWEIFDRHVCRSFADLLRSHKMNRTLEICTYVPLRFFVQSARMVYISLDFDAYGRLAWLHKFDFIYVYL